MSKNSAIGWCHHTFNPWWGCENVSPECDHCYAEGFAKRTGHGVWGKLAPRRFFGDKHWAEPLAWNREAENAGERHRVFCMSMGDFCEKRPDLIEPRARTFRLIQVTPWLDWLLLTKRPQFLPSMLPPGFRNNPWPNVWLGVTCGVESSLWRVDALRKLPATTRFISMEPLLGPVLPNLTGIDWVIPGGESGPGRRAMELGWVDAIVERATAQGVKVFVKQDSAQRPGQQGRIPDRLWLKQFPAVRP